ncbi:hypothetical protein [Methanohalophilus sp. RSK]|uniref:hypothetical protein n=1 Tax=Methanohalophilus sp. RSK TaxID=2485783 RepID=UPI00131406CB|nr:hypothetical protein [Methanohalophilus sp. RSK]
MEEQDVFGHEKGFLSLAVLLFMIVLVYGLFFFVLVDSDQASYLYNRRETL